MASLEQEFFSADWRPFRLKPPRWGKATLTAFDWTFASVVPVIAAKLKREGPFEMYGYELSFGFENNETFVHRRRFCR
jgi:hypothetical protein